MSELADEARRWPSDQHQVIHVTLRRDGSAQTSNVLAAFAGDAFRVSVTTERAKTPNVSPKSALNRVAAVLSATF